MDRECKKHGITPHAFRKSGNRWRCKKCVVESVQRRRVKVKKMSIDYKGGCCSECGYNKCSAALEFHHLDPSKKDFDIGSKGYTRSWKKIKDELDKCILVCANCHREIHDALKL